MTVANNALRAASIVVAASTVVACSGRGGGRDVTGPTTRPTSAATSSFPRPGTYVTVTATAAEKLLVLEYNTTGIAGTLVVRAPGSAGTSNIAFVGKLVGGRATFSFPTGDATVTLVPDGFSLAQCGRWIPGATTVADCTFTRSGN